MDPANAKFTCGAECGIAATGTASAGTEHWSAVTGTAPTVVTSGPAVMRSTRAFRFNPSAATSYLTHTFETTIASPATYVGRCYIYFTTLPSADAYLFTGANALVGAYFKQSDSKIYAVGQGGTLGATGIAVTTGRWYRIDIKAVINTTQTGDVQVDGVACGQVSQGGQAANPEPGLRIGSQSTVTADFYIDDIVFSGTSGDYPIGDGTVAGLYPNADRTNTNAPGSDGNAGHVFSATTDFGKGAGGATATGAQNVEATSWQSLANPLSTSIATNFVSDLLGIVSEHLCWELDNLPANAVAINAVMMVVTTHSASSTANSISFQVRASTGSSQINGTISADLSEATITVPIKVATTNGTSTTWTVNDVNTSHIMFGNSTDVNPDPYCDGACLEVDYVPGAPVVTRARIAWTNA